MCSQVKMKRHILLQRKMHHDLFVQVAQYRTPSRLKINNNLKEFRAVSTCTPLKRRKSALPIYIICFLFAIIDASHPVSLMIMCVRVYVR